MIPDGVLETSIYVDDLAAAERFYTEVLGLPVIGREAGRHVFFRCGAGVFLVFNPSATTNWPAPHGARGPGHVAFAVRDDEIPRWRQRLAEAGVAVEHELEWPQGGYSLYFRDPAGNSLELATPRIWGIGR